MDCERDEAGGDSLPVAIALSPLELEEFMVLGSTDGDGGRELRSGAIGCRDVPAPEVLKYIGNLVGQAFRSFLGSKDGADPGSFVRGVIRDQLLSLQACCKAVDRCMMSKEFNMTA